MTTPVEDEEADWTRPPLAWLWDLLTFTALLGLYALCATTTLQGHDNAEWVSILVFGGVAHPPGYPLYSLLLRAWGLLPHTNHAFHAALLSGVLTAASVVVLTRALEQRNGHSFTARLAAIAFGLTLPVWRLAGVAEVTALTGLNAAALLWAIHHVDNVEEIRPRHGALLGALFGVGVAHHHSLVFLLPMLVPHVFLSHWGAGMVRWGKALLAGVVSGVAVLVAAWLSWRAWPTGPQSEFFLPANTFMELVRIILRLDYGTFSSNRQAGEFLWEPAKDLLVDTGWGLHLLALLALMALRSKRGWAVLVCWLLAGPWLLGSFSVMQEGGTVVVPLETRERFHSLPLMLVVVLASDALAAAAFQLPRRKGIVYARMQAVLVMGAVALGGITHLPLATWRGETAVETTLTWAVQAAPKDAVVVLAGDAWQMGWRLMASQLGREDTLPLHWPRSFNGDRPDVAAALMAAHCAQPCVEDHWHDALVDVAKTRPVVFFPATSAERVMHGEPLHVEGPLSLLGAGPPLALQASALLAWQEAHPLVAVVDDPRRYWERHCVAVQSAPWLILMDAAVKAGDAAVQDTAGKQAMAIMGRIPSSRPR